MKSRFSSIVGWICAILVAAFNLFAAVMKFVPQPPGSEGAEFMAQLGLTPGMEHVLGVIEFIIVALYIIPRTSTVGFVLMVGYMGGAMATNLTHGFSSLKDLTGFIIVFVLMTIGAYFRNPELLSRLLKRPTGA